MVRLSPAHHRNPQGQATDSSAVSTRPPIRAPRRSRPTNRHLGDDPVP
jgi:hypothetical protein